MVALSIVNAVVVVDGTVGVAWAPIPVVAGGVAFEFVVMGMNRNMNAEAVTIAAAITATVNMMIIFFVFIFFTSPLCLPKGL